jgi:hypothetical protein
VDISRHYVVSADNEIRGFTPPVSNTKTQGERAIRASQKAHRYRISVPSRPMDAYLNNRDAERYQAEADAFMQPGELVRGAGEVVRSVSGDSDLQPWMVDTLANPNMIGVNASEQRLEIAAEAGVLEAAVDAAESVQAANSLERMLCHQMAGAHQAGMKLLTRAMNERLPPLEAARLSNAGARMIEVYQQGLLTLQKLRTGGKQTVVVQHVQHVQVSGGQAVVASEITARERRNSLL